MINPTNIEIIEGVRDFRIREYKGRYIIEGLDPMRGFLFAAKSEEGEFYVIEGDAQGDFLKPKNAYIGTPGKTRRCQVISIYERKEGIDAVISDCECRIEIDTLYNDITMKKGGEVTCSPAEWFYFRR